jgi:hypothetical protein
MSCEMLAILQQPYSRPPRVTNQSIVLATLAADPWASRTIPEMQVAINALGKNVTRRYVMELLDEMAADLKITRVPGRPHCPVRYIHRVSPTVARVGRS